MEEERLGAPTYRLDLIRTEANHFAAFYSPASNRPLSTSIAQLDSVPHHFNLRKLLGLKPMCFTLAAEREAGFVAEIRPMI